MTKLKRLRLGYCQGMTLVAAVFAANEDAEFEERRCKNILGTSWRLALEGKQSLLLKESPQLPSSSPPRPLHIFVAILAKMYTV